MPEVVDVGRNPLGLVEEPLRHRLIDGGQVLDGRWTEGDAVPGHRSLPAESELVRRLFPRQPFPALERLFEPGPQGVAKSEAQVGIADQLADPVIDEALHQVFQLLGGELREFH